jgi:hypothetical protein
MQVVRRTGMIDYMQLIPSTQIPGLLQGGFNLLVSDMTVEHHPSVAG